MYPDNFSGRIENILKKCGLEDRHQTDYKDLLLLDKAIDYDEVDAKFEKEVDFAKKWLKDTLQKCEMEKENDTVSQ